MNPQEMQAAATAVLSRLAQQGGGQGNGAPQRGLGDFTSRAEFPPEGSLPNTRFGPTDPQARGIGDLTSRATFPPQEAILSRLMQNAVPQPMQPMPRTVNPDPNFNRALPGPGNDPLSSLDPRSVGHTGGVHIVGGAANMNGGAAGSGGSWGGPEPAVPGGGMDFNALLRRMNGRIGSQGAPPGDNTVTAAPGDHIGSSELLQGALLDQIMRSLQQRGQGNAGPQVGR